MIGSEILKSHWDSSKTVKQNLKTMGVAFDPNDPVKAGFMKKQKKNLESSGDEEMTVDTKPTEAVLELEDEASMGIKKERHTSPGEAKFILSLSQDFGTNYKAMVKDKRNYMQHTAKQLKRKFEAFFESSYYKKYTEKEKDQEEMVQ